MFGNYRISELNDYYYKALRNIFIDLKYYNNSRIDYSAVEIKPHWWTISLYCTDHTWKTIVDNILDMGVCCNYEFKGFNDFYN